MKSIREFNLITSVFVLLVFGADAQTLDDAEEMEFFTIEETSSDESFFAIKESENFERRDNTRSDPGKSYSIFGSIKQDFTYGVSEPGPVFTRNKTGIENIYSEFFLQAKSRLTDSSKVKFSGYVGYDWGNWRDGAYSLGNTEANFELDDLFLDLSLDSGMWLRVGNQIVARGQVESAKITDLVNPVDLSAPGQVELKDIRMQVPALLISTPVGDSAVELIVTSDAGLDKLGSETPGSAFDFSIIDSQIIALLPEGITAVSMDKSPDKNWEVVARLNYKINGGDVSLTAGEVNWNQSSLHAVTDSRPLQLVFGQDRVRVLGISGNFVRSDYLFKYESALRDGNKFQTLDPFVPWVEHKEIATAVGFDYSGLSETVLSAEFNSTTILNYSNTLARDESESGYLLQARWTGYNNLLSLYGAYNKFTGDDSSTATIFIEYDLTDNIQLDGRFIIYDGKSENDLLYSFRDQDVVKASVKYSF